MMLALGSRGDVQPFVALALALQRAGDHVTIAAAADYEALVTAYGVDFAPVGGHIKRLMNFDLVNQMLDGAHNPLYFARTTLREIDALLCPILLDCWQAAHEADLLLASSLGYWIGIHLVEKRLAAGRHCPLVAVHMHPFYPSATIAHVNFPTAPAWFPGRAGYHRLSHHLGWHGFGQLLRRPMNRARRTALALPSLSPYQLYRCMGQPPPTLFAYSPTVIPPNDEVPNDALVTGYWFLPTPRQWQPPALLRTFLAAGQPPVLVSFGSILGGRNPDQMSQLLVDALQASGQRGLIYRGWGDLGNIPLPPTILAIDNVPHDWLLPQVAAVVHHGGAGITAAALRAQCPAVIVPVFGD
ncbi:MAG: glycosyltransferase family 1 protein [Caldilineaceae bacterium]|nr:glycosyltransferase family 1 protein [Caldilineaceae bacterium]